MSSPISDQRGVSIVVIGRNEEAVLLDALRSARVALEVSATRGEVIFVDSCSEDRSVALASEEPGVRVVRIAGGSVCAARARNVGACMASFDWVQFLDADMTLEPGWLDLTLPIREEGRHVVVHGRITEENRHPSVWNTAMGMDWEASRRRHGLPGGAALWNRQCFIDLGGFRESLRVGEDPELALRARAEGHRIACLEDAMVRHDLGLEGPGDYLRRSMAIGRSKASVIRSRPHDRVAWKRGLAPLVWVLAATALAATAIAFGLVLPLLVAGAALVVRRAWLDRREAPSALAAWIHAVHVYAVKLPVSIGVLAGLRRSS